MEEKINEEQEIEQKKEKPLLPIILIVLIFLFSFAVGYVLYSRSGTNDYTYTGPAGTFNFTLDKSTGNNLHIITVYKRIKLLVYEKRIPFNYGPKELEIIPVEGENIGSQIKDSTKIIITRDVYLDQKTNNELIVAMLTVERIVGQKMIDPPLFDIPTELASIEENPKSIELELPVYTCDDATNLRAIIWFKEGTENRIYKQGDYCVVAEYKEKDDPKKIGTKLTYIILGVM